LQVSGQDGRRPPALHVEIIDDGPGMPPEIADSVFEPFVSGRENGTGLGLALVSKIIAAHEGLDRSHSAPRSDHLSRVAARGDRRTLPRSPGGLMDGTVLVADDDRTIRTVLTQALTRAGCRVHATSSRC
jgi:signal transduction histidine kinase